MSAGSLLATKKAGALTIPPLALALLGSALGWIALGVAFAPAVQDFPLNDDWAFARGAFLFARGQGIHYFDWASMPQLGQWLWASPFLWVLGASHFALRCSTVILGWLGLTAFYALLRQGGCPSQRAALAVAALGLNPLFFLLQGTFMTDVPALAMALVALALYTRALKAHSQGWMWGACAAAVLAALTRQNALAVPATAALLLGREPQLRRRPAWWFAVLLPAAVGLATYCWFQVRQDVRAVHPEPLAPPTLLSLPFVAIHYCGLAALPLVLLDLRVGPWKRFLVVLGLILAVAGYWLGYGVYFPYGGLFPYKENMLTPWGAFAGSKSTGPLVVGERSILLETPARVVLTLLGCAAGAAMLSRATESRRAGAWSQPLVLFALFQVPFLLVTPDLYDRYLVFLLPGALALTAQPRDRQDNVTRWGAVAAVGAVALLGLVSVGLMHDWLSWNAARWELGRRAISRHNDPIDPLDIEGGVEWDGWYASAVPASDRSARSEWPVLPLTRDWFPSVRGHYVLSFSELKVDGTRTVDSEPYVLWLQPGPRRFFLIEMPRVPPDSKHSPVQQDRSPPSGTR
jgi:4-amino-4-deoxy-L-arabinose transferase-like glycosyltransferase